ncbi:MAG: hypothetical protein GHCLOJNM_03891 [bacterium]|nr:hypothetical protein [bacterium]
MRFPFQPLGACFALLLAIRAGSALSPPAVRDFKVPADASPPFTYCISYLPDPDNPTFLGDLAKSPPDLFHLGYHIPFKGMLGPTFGHELFTNQILSPQEIPREVARVREVIRDMRQAGVRKLIPYVYTMALFGDPDKRNGFFNFFDHWEDYRAFGLGPKPATDPSLWTQARGPEPLGESHPGVLHYQPCVNHPAWSDYLDLVVRELARVGYDGMFFDVNTEACFCPHCQEKFDIYLLEKYGRAGLREAFGVDDHRELNLSTIDVDFEKLILGRFRQHLAETWIREKLGEVLDATEPSRLHLEDDWRLLRCYMQGSSGEFPDHADFTGWLKKRFAATHKRDVAEADRTEFEQAVLRACFRRFLESPELADELKRTFGSSDLRRRCRTDPKALLLWVETQRFWCDSMADLFARLKEDGRAVFLEQGRSEDFFTVANLGSMATVDGINKRRINGIDLPRWAPEADLQMFEEMHQPGTLASGVILSNIFAFRWAMAAGTRAGTLLYEVGDDPAADLANAEAAAGGGGAFIQPGLAAPEARDLWTKFFREHADLWAGAVSEARIALLFWSDQLFYEYPEHLEMTRRWAHILAECQVPFDIVTEEGLSTINKYEIVIAPRIRYMDNGQMAALLDHAHSGGKLLVTEPFGTDDKPARPRAANPLDRACPRMGAFQAATWGKGRILRLEESGIPRRESEFFRMMEERGNEIVRAAAFLNEAREAEVVKQSDLGGELVGRIEQALEHPLRWCPAETDPCLYVHPYRVPKSASAPSRLIVHLVNYRLPIELGDSSPREGKSAIRSVTHSGKPALLSNVQVRVPFSDTTEILKVFALSPCEAVEPVEWRREAGAVTMTIPALKTYQAVVLELKN